MGLIKTLKRITAMAVAYVALSTGCTSTNPIESGNDEVFVQQTAQTHDEEESYSTLVALSNQDGAYLKAITFDNPDGSETRFAARGKIKMAGAEGSAEILGTEHSNGNHGSGINARLSSGDTTVGGALEKVVDAGTESEMSSAYVSQSYNDWGFTGGVSDLDGDTSAIASVSYSSNNNFAGAGVVSNTDGDGFATVVAGKAAENRGEGFGYRAWAKAGLDGSYHVADFTFSTGTNFSIPAIAAVVAPDNGWLDTGLIDNRMDAHVYLWERGNGFIGNLKHSDIGGVATFSADAVMPLGKIGNVNPRINAGYKAVDDGTDVTESGSLGLGLTGPRGYADLTVTAAEGEKPLTALTVGIKVIEK